MHEPIVDRPGGATIEVRVVPRSRKTGIDGLREGALLIRLTAAPVDGAANDALIAFIADRLQLPRHRVQVISGLRSRQKRLLVEGLTAAEVLIRLGVEWGRAPLSGDRRPQ